MISPRLGLLARGAASWPWRAAARWFGLPVRWRGFLVLARGGAVVRLVRAVARLLGLGARRRGGSDGSCGGAAFWSWRAAASFISGFDFRAGGVLFFFTDPRF